MAHGQELQVTNTQKMRDLIARSLPQIKLAIPRHMNPDRMARIAMTEFQKNPALAKCDPLSFIGAVIQASQLGLEPGLLGQAYLIPYGKTCQFVPGWKGLVDLMSRTGRATVWTRAVYEGDHFEYSVGSHPRIEHRPCGEDDPAKITHFYACGQVNGAAAPVMEVWTVGRVKRHRDKFNKVGNRHYSFEHFEMYGRKVLLLQVLKYMPMSVEEAAGRALATGISVANAETQGESFDAIDVGFDVVATTEVESEAPADKGEGGLALDGGK